MDGVFITGTDTNVGKSIIAAGIVRMLHGTKPVCFWKPIQAGTIVGDDTTDVRSLLSLGDENFAEPTYRFADPISPYHAAKKWGKKIEVADILKDFQKLKAENKFPVIEGAGGLMLPLAQGVLQLDLIKALGLPVLIVSHDRVGSINQALLTLNACREHKIPIVGIVLTMARGAQGSADGIAEFGKVEILAEFAPVEDSRSLVAQVSAHPRLRQIFQVQPLP